MTVCSQWSVRIVSTANGVLLYLNEHLYNHSNGIPFYFATCRGALETAADEWEIAQMPAEEEPE